MSAFLLLVMLVGAGVPIVLFGRQAVSEWGTSYRGSTPREHRPRLGPVSDDGLDPESWLAEFNPTNEASGRQPAEQTVEPSGGSTPPVAVAALGGTSEEDLVRSGGRARLVVLAGMVVVAVGVVALTQPDNLPSTGNVPAGFHGSQQDGGIATSLQGDDPRPVVVVEVGPDS